MKRKTKRILVVGVKWRHRANGLFLNFECTFCGFLSRRCKNVENVLWNLCKYNRVFRMYLKFLQKPCFLGWFKTSRALRSAVKKTRLNFSKLQLHSEKLSFSHKKETEHSFELSLFICVFYRAYFQSWNTKFSLENHNMMNTRQPFCWWITLSKVSNPPLPPLSMWLTM